MGWNTSVQGKHFGAKEREESPLISIIVPARNEEKVIASLLEDLRNQRHARYEVIVVDDASNDQTLGAALKYAVGSNLFRVISSEGKGKKAALTRGIRAANGSIIVTTDADCRVKDDWIRSLTGYFTDDAIKIVFGAVRMDGKSFFARVQSLEFMSLIGSAAATAAIGFPTMCNGANLAFRKSVFEEVGGYEGNMHIASGDDEFLMRKVLARYPKGVVFAASQSSVVTTAPKGSINDFVQQRVRWAGKWRLHDAFYPKALALFIFCFQIAVMAVIPVVVLTESMTPLTGLMLWLCKALVEFVFLWRVSVFLHVSWHWPSFFFLQPVYPIYVLVIGLVSNFFSFDWKGRKHKSILAGVN